MIGEIPEAEDGDLCAHCPAPKGGHALIGMNCPNPEAHLRHSSFCPWLNSIFKDRPAVRCRHCDMGQDWHSSRGNCPAVPGIRNRGYRSKTFELPRTSWERLLDGK